jgi:monofunctional biosynthetic peptidoglycan transglycosylase
MRDHFKREEPVQFLPLGDIPTDIWRATLAIEDLRFYSHPGVDVESIIRAVRLNRTAGRIVYGASTVTQQLARTLYLSLDRSYARKYVEVLAAFGMEMVLSKRRILELYLNYAEWGPAVYGVAEASLYHFGVPPAELSDEQEQMLVTLLASPIRYGPDSYATSTQLRLRHRSVARFYALMREHRTFESTIRRVD